MSVSSYGSRSRLSTCFLTKPPFLRAYTVASPSCSTSASSPPASPSSPSASEQQTMRRPHLLDECSLHCGSLAASTAVVDGSPAQRASASHLIRCMTERGPRGRELSAKPPGVKTNAVLYITILVFVAKRARQPPLLPMMRGHQGRRLLQRRRQQHDSRPPVEAPNENLRALPEHLELLLERRRCSPGLPRRLPFTAGMQHWEGQDGREDVSLARRGDALAHRDQRRSLPLLI